MSNSFNDVFAIETTVYDELMGFFTDIDPVYFTSFNRAELYLLENGFRKKNSGNQTFYRKIEVEDGLEIVYTSKIIILKHQE